MSLARCLAALASVGYRNSRWHLTAAMTVLATAPFLIHDLRIDADAAKLIPSSDPVGVDYRYSKTAFGESNPVVVELRHDDLAPAELDALSQRLAAILEQWDDVRSVRTKPLDFDNSVDTAWRLRAALLNAEPAELEAFSRKLTPEGMRRELLKTRKRLVALDRPRLRLQVAADPLDIGSHLAVLEQPRVAAQDSAPRGVYFEGSGGRSRLLYVQPLGSAEDTAYCRRLLERICAAVDQAGNDTGTLSGVEHRVTGVHAITAQSAEVLIADLALMTVVASAAVFVLVWLAFGHIRATLVCFLPLLVAQLAVLSLARLLFNPINPLTIGFAAVVVGLGLDIGLHVTGRLAQVMDSSSLETAIRTTFVDVGPPVVVGAVSTTLAFLALATTGNRGLVQFGVLTALGIVVTLIVTLLLFPALARHLLVAGPSAHDLKLRGSPAPLLRFVTRRPGTAIAIGLLLAGIAVPYALRFRFDTDVMGLFADDLEAVDVAAEIAADTALRPGAMTLVAIRAGDLPSAMQLQHEVDRRLVDLVAQGVVSAFESPSRYLVYPSGPVSSRGWQRTGESLIEARDRFFALLEELGFRVGPAHHAYYDILETAAESAPTKTELRRAERQISDLERFVDTAAAGVLLQTYVVTANDTEAGFGFDAASTRRVTSELRAMPAGPGATLAVSGLVQVYERAQERIVADFRRVSWVALLLVGAVSFLFFRRPGPTILTFVPLAAALPTTLAATIWLDIPVMPFATSFAAIVVGIGIDDAVHILARVDASREHTVPTALAEVGPVITLTTLSTILAFGVLALSRLAVVASLGIVVVGVAACWLFSLLLLPAAIQWTRRSQLVRTLAASVMLAGAASANFAQTKETGEILRGMEERFESVEAVSCDIEQVKFVEQLASPIHLSGTLLVQKPALLKLELTGDENLSLLCDGETVWLVDHDLDTVDSFGLGRSDAAPEQILLVVFFSSRQDVEARFEISSIAPDVGKHRLELVPKSPQDAPFTRLLIDLGRNFGVKRLHAEYANGDTVTTKLESCQRSERLLVTFFRGDGF